jgi:hypothetical protein
MVDLIEFRMSKLVRRSEQCRRLIGGLLPAPVSAEIAAVADEYEQEVVRMEHECLGKKSCPCSRFNSCYPVA